MGKTVGKPAILVRARQSQPPQLYVCVCVFCGGGGGCVGEDARAACLVPGHCRTELPARRLTFCSEKQLPSTHQAWGDCRSKLEAACASWASSTSRLQCHRTVE